tara:strand:+ start:1102 stop:1485 length:384 start_codon:yes stop_codon:yes gene_type:complete
MNQLESLISKHAEYSDLKSDLKRKAGVELSNHKYSDLFEDVFCGENKLSNDDIIYGTCGNHAYKAVQILNVQNDGGYGYDEVLNVYGCESCIKARALKIEMGFIGTKLGQIRGAITRVGRKLNDKDR